MFLLLLPADLHFPREVTSAFFKIISNSGSDLELACDQSQINASGNEITIQPARQNGKQVKIRNRTGSKLSCRSSVKKLILFLATFFIFIYFSSQAQGLKAPL